MTEQEDINSEIMQIDLRLCDIDEEIDILEKERQQLLLRRNDLNKRMKGLMPSSTGGTKMDQSADWNRNDFKWSDEVNKKLKTVFGLNAFRPLQLETINVTLSREDCILVIPTGGGKSLTFQLPALIDEGVTIVVSPLVSLIEDQLWILKSLNINASTLNSSSSKEHVNDIYKQMVDLNSNLKLLYVTPEKLAKSKAFLNKVEKMYGLNRFSRLVIDEVHCCSTYGNDFRPDYKFLGVMKRLFPKVCILGLTATATYSVIEDIKKILNLSKCVLFKSSFNRPNISYEVRPKPSNNDECMNEIAELINSKFSHQSGIVYCFSQKESEQVAVDLCKRGIKSGSYHAQMDSTERTKVHESWIKNKVYVIVATIAFGMGIDKNDCRFVIHHSLSKSLENFYQESGRAGRDGKKAYSILFFRYQDVFRQSSLVFTEQTGLTNLYSIVNYCINLTCCKRTLIAKHFNDDFWNRNRDGIECNKMCDYCSNLSTQNIQLVNCVQEARIVVDIINKYATISTNKDKEKKLTASKLAELAFSEISNSNKTKTNKTSSKLNSLKQNELECLILILLMKQYLKEDFHFTPYNTICYLVAGNKASQLPGEKEINIYLIKNESSDTIEESYVASKKTEAIKRKAAGTTESKSIARNKDIDLCFSDDDDDDDDYKNGSSNKKINDNDVYILN